MTEKVTLEPAGLYTFPNNLSVAPSGSLVIANDVVLDKDKIIESRRGQFQYGTALPVGTGQIDKIFPYRNNLIASGNGTLFLDSNGSGSAWDAYTGTYVAPSGYKMRSTEANQNFYFTTTNGVYKLELPTAEPVLAGMPPGLDGTATTTGTIGFLNLNSNANYRIVWGTTDLNQNEILGAPSQQILASNPGIGVTIGSSTGTTVYVSSNTGLVTGMIFEQNTQTAVIQSLVGSTAITVNGTFSWTAGTAVAGYSTNISLTFTIPQGIGTTNYYQIYRTAQVSPVSVSPSDEEQLVAEGNVTSAQISAGQVTYIDTTPDSELQAFLYTNPSQGGILQANARPPFCTDITSYQGYNFFANCLATELMSITLTAVGGTSGLNYYTGVSGTTTNLGTTITGISSGTQYRVGQLVQGSNVPSNTFITATTGSTLVISKAATGNGATTLQINDTITIGGQSYFAAGTTNASGHFFAAVYTGAPSIDIAKATATLINVINLNPNTTIYAQSLSGFTSLPGQIELESVGVNQGIYYVTSSCPAFISGNNTVPASGTSLASTQASKPNYLYYSQYLEPESVPTENFIPVGNADYPILRIIPLREALFILKQDGIFYLSGLVANQFTINNLDYTTTIRAIESAVTLNNQVYLFSRQGVVELNSSGVQVVSRAIESQLLTLASDLYPNFDYVSFAVPYESDRKYIFYTVSSPSDTYPTQAFVYNYLTQAWTQWILAGNRTCGVVNPVDDKLYTGNAANDIVYVERKDFELTDYADEQYPVSISSSTGTNVTLTGTTNVAVGQALFQNGAYANITAIGTGNVVSVDNDLTWAAGSAYVYNPIINTLSFNPNTCDTPGIIKTFRELTYFFQNAQFESISVGYTTDYNNALLMYPITAITSGEWGNFAWGDIPWGGSVGGQQTIRTWATQNNTKGHWLNINVVNSQCFTALSLQGVTIEYNLISTRQH